MCILPTQYPEHELEVQMNLFFISFLACGDKTEDTATLDDTAIVEDTSDTSTEELEVIGSYTDSWGGTLEVTAETITDGYGNSFHISAFDNEGNWLVAQNDAANEYFPELWSLFDWTEDAGQLYYCQSMFDAATADDAQNGTHANVSDLQAGCGGFGWTALTVQ